MTDRLTEIKARLDKATPLYHKPAHVDSPRSKPTNYSNVFALEGTGKLRAVTHGQNHRADADFIANCPSDIAWLIAELEKERAENARQHNIIQQYSSECIPRAHSTKWPHVTDGLNYLSDKRKEIETVTEFRCGTETVFKDGTKEFIPNE